MNEQKLSELKQLIKENPSLSEVGIPASIELISSAENFLDVQFPSELKTYFTTWGTLAFGPLEFYGLPNDNFISGKIPNGVWFTQLKREQLGLPKDLFVILNNENDEYHCIHIKTGAVIIWCPISSSVIGVKSAGLFEYMIEESSYYQDLNDT